MQSFFILRSRRGPIPDAVAAGVDRALRGRLLYADQVTHACDIRSRSGTIVLLGYTNEPRLNLWRAPDGRAAFASGYTTEGAALLAARPDASFGKTVTSLPGRFSAVLFDPAADRVAAANSFVAVDGLYIGERDDLLLLGTQASAIASALVGDLRYDAPGLMTFMETGFFGSHDTAFAGVSWLPPGTTWHVADGVARRERRTLGDLKRASASRGDGAAAVSADLAVAVRQISVEAGPPTIGLTGGKDSRLMVVALLAGGIRPRATTLQQGPWAAADVHVAGLLAKVLGLEHVVRRGRGSDAEKASASTRLDYLARAAGNLLASDGGLDGYPTLKVPRAFRAHQSVAGLGGELLRAGYAEKRRAISRESLKRISMQQFARHPSLFRADVRARHEAFLDGWLADFDDLEPIEGLDALYAEFRCGRWIGASSRGASTGHMQRQPYLDNCLSRTVIGLPAADKNSLRLVRDTLAALCPAVTDIPLANKFWPGTTDAEKERIRAEHPEAFTTETQARVVTDWRRTFPPVVAAHIRSYCVDEGRIELLRDSIELDAVRRFLRGDPAVWRKSMKVVHGIYAACVLVSGDWLRSPTAPIRLTA